ncbi:sensor histidine kinase [Nocardioides jiangxiensis]|uniref:Sensor-like histidine kinase SenX3 n=1 Tax=Nocardioides jiangxiensis TaxID=3064524 RepID=A0ABT9AYF8_9ACTN|nr:GAF domain-containing sensor histidine kinase [Nocardioides sp. WY-20]MDO7867611.1 GAF domain-containing sensor histidine kinase [Nocardioides sp. WY-20]
MKDPAVTGQLLTTVVEQLSTADSVERVTAIVAAAVRDLMEADGATFVLCEDAKCFYADEDAVGPLWKGSRFPLSACVSGWAMLHGEPAVIPDIYLDDRVPHDAYRPTFVKSMAMVPIRSEDPIGALGAYWSEPHTPSPEQVRLVEVLAGSAAVALENLELRGAVVRRVAERDHLESAVHTLVHDLRNPLFAMLGCAELLVDEADPESVRELARTILRSGQRLDAQIDRMLAVYRITHAELRPEQIDLTALAGEIAQPLVRSAGRSVDLDIEDGLRAHLDPVMADLMLRNLLDNAFKYTGRQDSPRIRLARTSVGPRQDTFVVADNGAGFDPRRTEDLFRPLTRLHDSREFPGTGLGLASVARIVELHGGTIRAEGRVGAGASFYLSLPHAA